MTHCHSAKLAPSQMATSRWRRQGARRLDCAQATTKRASTLASLGTAGCRDENRSLTPSRQIIHNTMIDRLTSETTVSARNMSRRCLRCRPAARDRRWEIAPCPEHAIVAGRGGAGVDPLRWRPTAHRARQPALGGQRGPPLRPQAQRDGARLHPALPRLDSAGTSVQPQQQGHRRVDRCQSDPERSDQSSVGGPTNRWLNGSTTRLSS